MLGAMPTVRPRPLGSPLGSATVRAPRRARWLALTTLAAAGLVAITSCERRRGCAGEYCGTLVFAAPGEPDILLPAVAQQRYAQDIAGQRFLKLADLGLSENTVGDEDFQPQLAERWEWDDPLTLVFHLDPRAHWQDGRPVTAADVAFTFVIYTDSLVNSPFRSSLRTISAVTTRDSLTAVFRFHARYPEMFYDAVDHMRILPAHLLRPVPRSQWRSAALGRAPVGDGPYRFVAWKAGESVELAADSTFFLGRPHIRRLIWRFTPDLQVAITQVIAGDADAVEVLGPPDNVKRARAAPNVTLYPYHGALYGFLAFNLSTNGDTAKPHPLFGDRLLRRALAMAVDREGLRQSVWGDLALVPPGPLARIWSIWDPETRELPHDTAQAARLLTRLGWRDSNGDGIRDRDGQPLAFRILVPTTSQLRRQYARLLQEQFRRIGADVQLDEVEFSVFDQRTQAGRFDAAVIARGTDPTPSSSIAQVWTSGADEQRQLDPEVIARLRRQFGLDRPLPVQYVLYLRNLLRGELGQSFSQHRPVAAAIADAIPPTLTLAGAALVIDFALGLGLGVYQAVRARRFGDIALGNVALFFNSMPTFWLGLVLLLVFGQWLHVFPVGGMRDPVLCPSVTSARCLGDLLWHLTLPALTLGLVGAAATARYQRAALLEVAGQDYVRTARAKGLRESRVLLVHALRNALLPFITLVGLAFPFLLTGAVLVERVFAWPGMGRWSVAAIFQREYAPLTAAALVP